MHLLEKMYQTHKIAKTKRLMEEGVSAKEIVEELRKDDEFFYNKVLVKVR